MQHIEWDVILQKSSLIEPNSMENVPTTVKKVIELLVATYSIEWCGSLGQINDEILHWLLNEHYMLQDIIFSALDAGLECNIRISTVAGP